MSLISELLTKFTADNTGLNRGVDEASSKINNFSKIAAAGITSFSGYVSQAIAKVGVMADKLYEVSDKYSKLYDESQKIGIDPQKFAELAHVADEAGLSGENLIKIFSKMNRTIGQAQAGSKEANDAFRNLGLSVKDLLALPQEQRYIKIAEAIRNLGGITQQSAAAFPIFGRMADQQLGLINSGVEESISKYRQLGVTLTATQQANLDLFSETRKTTGELFTGIVEKTSAEFAPTMTKFLEDIQNWVKDNGGIDQVAKKFAEVASDAWDSLKTVGGLLKDATNLFVLFGQDLGAAAARITIAAQKGRSNSELNVSGLTDNSILEKAYPRQFQFTDTLSSGAVSASKPLESSIQSIRGADFISKFEPWMQKAADAAEKFAKAADKSADDLITNALKSSAGTGDLLGKIVSGANAGKVKADTTDFESLASELINFSQNNPGDFFAKQYQSNSLARLESMANFAQQQGEDATAMREVLKSLQAFVTKQQGANEVQKLEVTLTPTKYAQMEWSLSSENKTIVGGIVEDRMAREARGVSR